MNPIEMNMKTIKVNKNFLLNKYAPIFFIFSKIKIKKLESIFKNQVKNFFISSKVFSHHLVKSDIIIYKKKKKQNTKNKTPIAINKNSIISSKKLNIPLIEYPPTL